MTELEAINFILLKMGENPVDTISTEGQPVEVLTAQKLIQHYTKLFQSRGLSFNKDYRYPLEPTVDNEVYIPANTTQVTHAYNPDRYTVRAGRMYDKINRTFTITETMYVNMVTIFDFEDLPDELQQYITATAAYWALTAIGAFDNAKMCSTEVTLTKANFERAEAVQRNMNIFNNPQMNNIIDRGKSGGFI